VKEIEKDSGIFELSGEALMNHLFIKNFVDDIQLTGVDTVQLRLITINSLDECCGRHIQHDPLRIIAAIVLFSSNGNYQSQSIFCWHSKCVVKINGRQTPQQSVP
jgi:hypothetical protein